MKTARPHAFATFPAAPATAGTASRGRTLPGWFEGIVGTLVRWQARAEGRRHLREIDDRLLADMGISRIDALRESRKPFWRA